MSNNRKPLLEKAELEGIFENLTMLFLFELDEEYQKLTGKASPQTAGREMARLRVLKEFDENLDRDTNLTNNGP